MFIFRFRVIFCFFIFCFSASFGYATLAQETIYLTWMRSPSTTMTIQWITPLQESQSAVSFALSGENSKWSEVKGVSIPFPLAPRYLIHRVEIQGLQPNSEYVFKVHPYEEEYRFLTAPAKLDKELRFVVGGDMYHDGVNLLIKTAQKAAATDPLFALIGGDIAYAVPSGFFSSHQVERWVEWLKVWHKYMVTSKGLLIPVVAAIGNHDLNGGFDQTQEEAKTFLALFPRSSGITYDVLDFDSYLTIIILDSGHAAPIKGKQSEWLSAVLENRKAINHRFAVYHVPAYPSVRDGKNTYSASIRSHFVPLFERGGIQAAFEHHDHAYKRTRPLIRGHANPQGIVYFGDGGWGVEKPRALKRKYPYLAHAASLRHFIAVSLFPQEQQFKAIDDEGRVFDEYRQQISIPQAKAPALETPPPLREGA